jgi:hypothetical protein
MWTALDDMTSGEQAPGLVVLRRSLMAAWAACVC